MPAIKDINLADLTVDYNGVQFGGADSDYRMMPPIYQISGRAIYDDAGRTVSHIEYTMTVQTVVYNTTESTQSAQMDILRGKLLTEGKTLKIKGLGFGFSENPEDYVWGPKPISCNWTAVGGAIGWELIWVVQFNISECFISSNGPMKGAFLSGNYAVTWQYDEEGVATRDITGYVQIVSPRRDYDNNTAVIADDVRPSINCLVPNGFRRIAKSFPESADKSRLNFSFTDEELPGDAPPPGVTLASGNISFDSNGIGFAEGRVTMNLSYRMAKKVAKQEAAALAFRAFITKQNEMLRKINGGAVLPDRVQIRHEFFDDVRTSHFSMSWSLTKCFNTMLAAAGLWDPVPGSANYSRWRASMESLGCWSNTGIRDVISLGAEDVIINVCNQTNSWVFGQVRERGEGYKESTPPYQFACPELSEEGSWLGYDVRVQILRKDRAVVHTRAVDYSPNSPNEGTTPINLTPSGDRAKIGAPPFTSTSETETVVEQAGLPRNIALLQFKGMRVKFKPQMPTLESVGGLKVVHIETNAIPQLTNYSVFECPVWALTGYSLYEVIGDVSELRYIGAPNSCGGGYEAETPTKAV